ncbi:WYL domain-containing protein [Pseudomonas sp. SWI6]|uniref:WYL domain-containing protein n=1 Tax=Pseudomonas taiwanensis TaxID=470150 RepID=A0ABR6V8Z1_9PSED|nr:MULTISPECIES: WYL domain-containing protein [Pseudomonas]AGZ37744.1 transcriptional factor-like protein [Pseudomonas sp. VLB120]AVD80975.1 WYL domain-containing protein [Pseudomonas sp. SWI6]AVD87905.1 WYL domain-containing protein [Pseudomonas sp. SWI44]MBC3476981.1 WYL domain-containing protein [Pseudomonas taiwanensis]MBC3489742.1 WYL domain-containing protein [Pseudomonas taiwanensis]
MPFATTRATLSRQWALLRQLPSRSPGTTSAELVWRLRDVGFNVSKRTVERDLNELSLIFPLERNDKSIPFGWHWSANPVGDLRGNFDLQGYLRGDALQPPQGDGLEVQLWISDTLARQLRESPLCADMRLTALDQGHRLQATLSDGWPLRWWLLSQGDQIEVELPIELRQEVANTLNKAAARYQG